MSDAYQISAKKRLTSEENIPYFNDLVSFYKHVKARPPLHKDFDIREIDPEVLKSYDYVAKPFRHSFYCITLFLQGDITLNAGFWKTRMAAFNSWGTSSTSSRANSSASTAPSPRRTHMPPMGRPILPHGSSSALAGAAWMFTCPGARSVTL